jgi:succinate dehydrogenase hydrophobic anchor subunit
MRVDPARFWSMLPKIVIVLLLIAIIIALFTGLRSLLQDPSTSDNRRTLRALTWRVALQVGLIVFLILAYFLGWIHPHAVGG